MALGSLLGAAILLLYKRHPHDAHGAFGDENP
jgi:hypothetical protein